MNPIKDSTIKLFFKYSIYSTLGLLAMTSAGVVDGYFVGNYVGAEALASINIIMPIMSLFIGLAICFAIGGGAMCAKLLGKNCPRTASILLSRVSLITFGVSFSFALIIYLNLSGVLSLLGANEEIMPFAKDYLGIALGFFPIFAVAIVFDNFVRADNRPSLAFFALFFSAIINMVLDYLFIVVFEHGIKGAALATGLSQLAILIVLLPHFFSKKSSLRFASAFKKAPSVFKIAYNGLSELINECSIGITTFVFNITIILYFGTQGVAAFTVISYLIWIGLMAIFGSSDSLQPLIGQNFGAKKPERIKAFLSIAYTSTFGVGLICVGFLLLAPELLTSIFLQEGSLEAKNIALIFASLVWPLFLFNGFNIATSAYFTAMQQPKYSTIIAVLRSLIFPVIFITSLPIFFGEYSVFVALPLAEFCAFLISCYLLYRYPAQKLIQRG